MAILQDALSRLTGMFARKQADKPVSSFTPQQTFQANMNNVGSNLLEYFKPQTGTLATMGRNTLNSIARIPISPDSPARKLMEGLYNTQNKVVTLPMQFGSGLIQGQNLTLGQKPFREPSNIPEQVAYTAGAFAGSLNPKSATQRVARLFVPAKALTPVPMLKNALVGSTLSPAMKTASTLLGEKRLPTSRELVDSALSGVENSWTLAITNSMTDKVLGTLAPKLVGKAITKPFEMGQVKEGFKRVFLRALAEVPAENTAFTALDKLNDREKADFFTAWMQNLPGSVVQNLAMAGISGSGEVIKSKASRQAISDSLQKAFDSTLGKEVLVGTNFDKNTGEYRKYIKIPRWKAILKSNSPGFINPSAKIGGEIPSPQSTLSDIPSKATIEEALPSLNKINKACEGRACPVAAAKLQSEIGGEIVAGDYKGTRHIWVENNGKIYDLNNIDTKDFKLKVTDVGNKSYVSNRGDSFRANNVSELRALLKDELTGTMSVDKFDQGLRELQLPSPQSTIGEIKPGKVRTKASIAKMTPEERITAPLLETNSQVPVPVTSAAQARKLKAKGFTNLEYQPKTTQGKKTIILGTPDDVKPKPGDFMSVVRRYVGGQQASETISNKVASEFVDIPSAKGKEFIDHVEGVTKSKDPLILAKADRWKQVTEELHSKLQSLSARTGQKLGHIEGYVTHIWKETPEQVQAAMKSLQGKSRFGKERSVLTYEEGIKAGLTPKSTNPAEILQMYVQNLKKVEAGSNFLEDLKANGFIENKPKAGYSPVTVPGISSNNRLYYAPRVIADKLNNLFKNDSELSGIARVSSKFQDIGLSGGVPLTPANAFTFGQIIKDLSTLSPFRTARTIANFVRSSFPKATRRYFLKNADDLAELQMNGVSVNPDMKVSGLIDTPVMDKITGSSVGDVWSALVNKPTFSRFMPMQVLSHYQDVKKAAIKQGLSGDEAAQLAAKATKMWTGISDSAEVATRSKLWEDAKGTFFFAPKFRESMINFWVNNVKALKNPLALENRANIQFIVGATTTYLLMDKANYLFNGKHMSENPAGTEDKLLIPYGNGKVIGIPFLSSIATIPKLMMRAGYDVKEGQYSKALAELRGTTSMMIRPALDVAVNQDYFGNDIYNAGEKNQGGNIASYLGSQYLTHPYLKELTDKRYKESTPIERAARMTESPFRFYDEKGINSKYYYGEKDAVLKNADSEMMSKYNLLHPTKNPYEAVTATPETTTVKDKMEKAMIRANNPDVYFMEREIATRTAQKTGLPIDPIYTIPAEQAVKYFRYQSLPPASKDAKDMAKVYPYINEIGKLRSDFFKANPLPTTTQSAYNTKPQPSDYVQQQMAMKNWKDPQVSAFLDANSQWNDAQRALLGLTPASSSSGGYGTSKKKIKAIKLPKTKVKTLKVKKLKIPKLKVIKPKAIKLPKPKKIRAR